MARIGKAQRALDRAHEHRQKIEQLLAEPDCLRPWFLDWAESQLKRDRFTSIPKPSTRCWRENWKD